MITDKQQADPGSLFIKNLPPDFILPIEPVGRRLLAEYGAVFVARGGAVPPGKVIFENEVEVAEFQNSVPVARAAFGEFSIELQHAAMERLIAARREAGERNLSITPRNADAAGRNYSGTVANWASRVLPGLDHWVAQGRLEPSAAERIRSLSPFEQVPEIFRLESEGLFFSKDLSKPIIYSVAPPGASQHLSLLALDVAEFNEPEVCRILARHGWFQTVVSDLPHFTFVGLTEEELPKLGLKKKADSGRDYWVPDL